MCHTLLGVCYHSWGKAIAAFFTVIACVTSFVLILRHLRYNRHPQLRTLTIRILLMIPLYAADALLSFVFHLQYGLTSQFVEFVRQFYEAVVIFSVLQFLLVCIGGHRAIMHRGPELAAREQAAVPASPVGNQDLEANHDACNSLGAAQPIPHAWPMQKLLPPWGSARSLTKWCIRGTLPYVVISVVSVIVGLAMWSTRILFGTLEGEPGFLVELFSWALFIVSCLAITALYELAHGLRDRLEGLNPWTKLIAVKCIVFFTFWQGLLINLVLLQFTSFFEDFVDEEAGWNSPAQVAKGVNNFLLCIEMALISLAHFYAFPPDDYKRVLAARGVFLGSGKSGKVLTCKDFMNTALSFGDAVKYMDIFRTAWDAGVPKKLKRGQHAQHPSAVVQPLAGASDSEAPAASDSEPPAVAEPPVVRSDLMLAPGGSGTIVCI